MEQSESYNDKLDKRLVDMFIHLRMEGLSRAAAINKVVRDMRRAGSVVTEDYIRRVLE